MNFYLPADAINQLRCSLIRVTCVKNIFRVLHQTITIITAMSCDGENSIQDKLLLQLEKHGAIDSLVLCAGLDVDHQVIVGAIKSIQSHGEIISVKPQSIKRLELTDEGRLVLKNGSYEYNIFTSIPSDGGISQVELMKTSSNAKIGFSKAMSKKWIKVDKSSGKPIIFRNTEVVNDDVNAALKTISNGNSSDIDQKEITDLKKRKLIHEVIIKSFHVTKGDKFTLKIEKPETELTSQMIQDGTWKTKAFKDYNYRAFGVPPPSGHLHPLMKVRSVYRQIFLEMGFSEMPTNNYIESSFWNFDALFQPQQHPARDAHDTFFISSPELSTEFPQDYLEKVKTVHSVGGFGSQGYKYDWKVSEAQKNILRTHTTAVSARMLYKLAQGGFKPCKYFSIDKVFRNESLDATHLAEFHQVEGVVADYSVTLGDLMGILHAFFNKLGIKKLRFKPAYNPYTEPSMEIFSYHEGLKKWVEIGNSGIFRPEMLLPMGLPENVNVIAWGLSLERPTMIKYGINNIRDLVGHKVDLQMVYNNPVCRMDF